MDPLEFQELRSCFSAANTRSRTQLVPTDFWLDVVLGLDAGTRSRFSNLVMEGGWQSDSNVAGTLRKIQSGQSDSELEVEDDLLGTLAAQILEKFRVVKPPFVSVRCSNSVVTAGRSRRPIGISCCSHNDDRVGTHGSDTI